jgi:Cyclic nucleotide-binding domain
MSVDRDEVTGRVQQFMRKGQFDKALDAMRGLYNEHRSDPVINLRMGDLHVKAGDNKSAADCYYNSATLFEDQGHAAKAIASYKMVQRVAPRYKDAEERIDRLAQEKAHPKPARQGPVTGLKTSARSSEDTARIELSELTGPDEMEFQRDFRHYGGHGDMEAAEKAQAPENEELDEGLVGGSGLYAAGVTGAPEAAGEPAEPSPLFSDIPKAELTRLLGRMKPLSFARGDIIVREGEHGDSLYIIRKGGAAVETHVKGLVVRLAELGERDFFGEVSFLTGRPRTADIVATMPTEVLELSGDELSKIAGMYPGVEDRLRMFHESRVSDTISYIKAVSKEVLV